MNLKICCMCYLWAKTLTLIKVSDEIFYRITCCVTQYVIVISLKINLRY